MKTNKLLMAAVVATAMGVPIAGFLGETKMPQPMTFAGIEGPFFQRPSAGEATGQSGVASLERADEWLNSPPP